MPVRRRSSRRPGHLEDAPMIYEVRTYTLRPGTLAEFEERYAKRLPLREKHSKLGAFWHTEFGPLNQVIHVYPYDDRQRLRDAHLHLRPGRHPEGTGGMGQGDRGARAVLTPGGVLDERARRAQQVRPHLG